MKFMKLAIWNDHECKIVCIIWLYFMVIAVELFFNRKYIIVTDGLMMLCAGNQVLCNMWSYHFYDMTLSTE